MNPDKQLRYHGPLVQILINLQLSFPELLECSCLLNSVILMGIYISFELLHSGSSVVSPQVVLTGKYYYLSIHTPMLE